MWRSAPNFYLGEKLISHTRKFGIHVWNQIAIGHGWESFKPTELTVPKCTFVLMCWEKKVHPPSLIPRTTTVERNQSNN